MLRSSASAAIATLGIDLGKNSFHLVGRDERGAIVLRIKLSRIAWAVLARGHAYQPRSASHAA
jgi:hypothetical protein